MWIIMAIAMSPIRDGGCRIAVLERTMVTLGGQP